MTAFARRAAVIFVVAFALRGAHVAAISHTPFAHVLMGDARGYDRWAAEIAGGDWLGKETFYQAPLYPYVLGALYTIAGHDPSAARWLQAILGAFACVLLAWAGRQWFSERHGIVAGAVLAVYPAAIFFDGLIQKAALDNLLMCAVLAAAGTFALSERMALVPLLGVLLGLFALTRENALVFIVVLAAWIPWQLAARPLRDRMRGVLLLVAGVAIVLLPVGLRNLAVGGDFLLTTSQAGPNFYIGNHEGANGRYVPIRPGREIPEFERTDAREVAEQAVGHPLSPAAVSSYWWSRAFAWIRAHPGDWAALFVRKIAYTWNRAEIADTESLEVHASASPVLGALTAILGFGTLVAFAVPGMVVAWRAKPRPLLLYAMLFPFSIAVAVFYVFARYRFPMVPLLILFASAALVSGLDWIRDRKRRVEAPVAAAVAVGAILGLMPPMVPPQSSMRLAEMNLGIAFAEIHEYENAVASFRRAIALAPRVAQAHYELGRSLVALGRIDDAQKELQAAVDLDPRSADAHDELGALLVRRGDPAAAEAQFKEAHAIDPQRPTTLANLGSVALKQGRAAEAAEWYAQAIALAPAIAGYHYGHAVALIDAGRADEAIAELRETIRLDPASAAAYDDLGVTLARGGDLAGAERSFEAAYRIDPKRTSSLINLGGIAASRGENDRAADWYRKAIAVEPHLTAARLNLALVLEKAGRLDEARHEAQEALRLDPNNPDAARAAAHFGR
ncbi:MAG TPA: tetratricopeptide repeat protein [Candidatus Polarisedimenticolaceae bacterium]|nr:tetratricopeptide repeat protein [Candidatus Polarisedimenticolaceae bacterium]